MKEKVCQGRSHNHDTISIIPKISYFLSRSQGLADHLKVRRRQLYNWRMAGLIPYFKMGKAVRFKVADVADAIERMRIG
jgi:hypothetical protein